MDEKTEKKYLWKETWRDHREFDWLCEMETCEEAIDSLKVHIENSDRLHEGRSIEEAEGVILDIEDEIAARDEHPEWPTLDHMMKYCGKYPVRLVDGCSNIRINGEPFLCTRERKFKDISEVTSSQGSGTWELTPELLRTRWVSEDDFYRWRMDQYGVRVALIEPMPKQLIDEYSTLVMSKVTKDTGRAAERIDTATRSDNISIFFTRYK
jgi:hypothetical protein